MENHPGDEGQQANIDPADKLFHRADALQPHDHLGADFETDYRAHQHDHAQFIVHVAELAMAHGGDQRFAGHVGDVGADGKGHGETEDVEAGGDHPGAAHAEETADDTDADAENDQAGPENLDARNGHENI